MLIQETVIEVNTEDKAVVSYIRKIRESAFMTEEELKAWKESAPKGAEEGEEAGRVRGRRHAGAGTGIAGGVEGGYGWGRAQSVVLLCLMHYRRRELLGVLYLDWFARLLGGFISNC